MALTGNKGEWSEIYTLLKLLSDTKVYSGDENLNKIKDLFYPIIKILRQEEGANYEFQVNPGDIVILGEGKTELRLPVSEFKKQAELLFEKIKSTSGTFPSPETEAFMNSVYCTKIKAKSSDKTDIKIVIHDLRTGMCPTLGFSIKSKLGHPSTLLNPGRTTNFIYKITDAKLSNEQITAINAIDTKIRDRIEQVSKFGCKLQFTEMESQVFMNNLTLIDSSMPEIVAHMLKLYYEGYSSNVRDIVLQLQKSNPLGYDISGSHKYYEYKVKKMLTDIALGMTPSKIWNGHYDANGGYLVVKEDGEVLCYHIYNKNDFEDYLMNNTKLDTPSTSRYGFGKIDDKDSTKYLKLNLQIRFK